MRIYYYLLSGADDIQDSRGTDRDSKTSRAACYAPRPFLHYEVHLFIYSMGYGQPCSSVSDLLYTLKPMRS